AVIVLTLGFYLISERSVSNTPVTSFLECEAAGYSVGESYPRQCWTPKGEHFVEEIEQNDPLDPSQNGTNQVTIRGAITCLPKLGSGAETLECAMGLKSEDGSYYGLKNLFENDPQGKFSNTNSTVEVTGVVTQEEMLGPDGNRYNTVGVIHISSIKEY
ncbi:MAG: hypothetical protein WD874_00495, partial [Parcubacteria group bacterium]